MSNPNLNHEVTARLPTRHGVFEIHVFKDVQSKLEHLALTMGLPTKRPLLRIHSECMTGDVFGAVRCDCGPQLDQALNEIHRRGAGIALYLRQEGRGIGLVNKLKAYVLQDAGLDTVEANLQLGYPADLRRFDVAAEILRVMGVHEVELMTNNPDKVSQLESSGIRVLSRQESRAPVHPENARYLATKVVKLNHQIDWLME